MKKKTNITYYNFKPSAYLENYTECDLQAIAEQLNESDYLNIKIAKTKKGYRAEATLFYHSHIIKSDMEARMLDLLVSSLTIELKVKMTSIENKIAKAKVLA